jgi:AraC family ethanolamine operon transcriptional activator
MYLEMTADVRSRASSEATLELEESPPTNADMPAVRRASVTESDGYTRSVAGVNIDVVRTGAGSAPTQIRSAVTPVWAGSSLTVGFPVFSRTELASDRVGVAVIERAPPGMRWCGIDLSSGDVLVYAPEAKHVAAHPEGAGFSFAVFSIDRLYGIAEAVDSAITPEKGSVERVASTKVTRNVRTRLPSSVRGELGASVLDLGQDGLAEAVAYMLASSTRDEDARPRKLDNRLIVHASIDFAEQVNRIPTIAELSAASHVSERRLNSAFVETHDVPPHQFFMTWALDLARRRLTRADPERITVSWIAMGSGFNHLGRFARYYRKTYGESPSETLRRVESLG